MKSPRAVLEEAVREYNSLPDWIKVGGFSEQVKLERMNMNKNEPVICDECGHEMQIGEFPFCPHELMEDCNYSFRVEGGTPKSNNGIVAKRKRKKT